MLSVHGDRAEVDCRGKRLHVSVRELRAVAGGGAPTAPGRVTVEAETSDGLLPDLNVVGQTVEDACARVDKYLDQALLQEQRQVRIIHGHGTGRLRRSIAKLLGEHPHVEKVELPSQELGGHGVTIVELKV